MSVTMEGGFEASTLEQPIVPKAKRSAPRSRPSSEAARHCRCNEARSRCHRARSAQWIFKSPEGRKILQLSTVAHECGHIFLHNSEPGSLPRHVKEMEAESYAHQYFRNGVRTVIVEDASRFARELMAQELGITLLISRGVRLLTASGDDLTASDDPTRKMMRQIAGAFAEYEKARLVSKLRHAREREARRAASVKGASRMGSCDGPPPGKPQDRQAHEPTEDRSRPRRGWSSQ